MDSCEDLFGLALSMAAGLYNRFDPALTFDRFRVCRDRKAKSLAAQRRLLTCPEAFEFRGLHRANIDCAGIDLRRSFFVVSGCGLLHAAVHALQRIGFAPAFVYRHLDGPAIQSIFALGVRLIDAGAAKDFASLFHLMREAQSDGLALVLRADVPGESRNRYSFLGYNVQCAKLIEVYAKRTGCSVIPIVAQLRSRNILDILIKTPTAPTQTSTQLILADIERDIMLDPDGYNWSIDSIVFSDRHAIVNGLIGAAEFLRWRENGWLENSNSLLLSRP
jgi:hypothetical protein